MDHDNAGPTEAGAIADLAVRAASAPIIIETRHGREFLVTPDNAVKDVTEANSIAPIASAVTSQLVTLQTLDSLVDYTERFKTEETQLFADIDRNAIVAVIDYHAAGYTAFVAHRASLVLPFSMEWAGWTAIDGKMMEQLEFARFLEENAGDIEAPSGAELLDVCRDLQAIRKVDFRKAVRTSSDNESFEYSDETTATTKKGDVEVPTKFQLRIPVYFNGATVVLFAFLRWRLEEGNLKLGIRLNRPEHVRQAEFKQIVLDAAARADRPAVFGRLG